MSDDMSVGSSSVYDDTAYYPPAPPIEPSGGSSSTSVDSSAEGWAVGTIAAAEEYCAANDPIGAPPPAPPTVTVTVTEGPPEVDAGTGDGVDASPDDEVDAGAYSPPPDPYEDFNPDDVHIIDPPADDDPDAPGGAPDAPGPGSEKPNSTSANQKFTPADGSGEPNFSPNIADPGPDQPPVKTGPSPAVGLEFGVAVQAGGGAAARMGVFIDRDNNVAVTLTIGKREGTAAGATIGPSLTYAPGGLPTLDGHSYGIEFGVGGVTGSASHSFTPGQPVTTPPTFSVALPIPGVSGGQMFGTSTEHDLTRAIPIGQDSK
jgi:hypothetical protein